MASVLLAKYLNALKAVDPEGDAVLAGIAMGDVVRCKITKPRNIQQHRLFFALMHLVFENQDRYDQFPHFMVAVKVALGHCDTVILKTGETAFIPRSISFAKMDQTEFNDFFDRTLDLVVKHWLPTVTSEQLRQEVYEMTGLVMPKAT